MYDSYAIDIQYCRRNHYRIYQLCNNQPVMWEGEQDFCINVYHDSSIVLQIFHITDRLWFYNYTAFNLFCLFLQNHKQENIYNQKQKKHEKNLFNLPFYKRNATSESSKHTVAL